MRYTNSQKMKYNFSQLQKFMIHVVMNIGPQEQINKDLVENLKNAQPPAAESSPDVSPETSPVRKPAGEEGE